VFLVSFVVKFLLFVQGFKFQVPKLPFLPNRQESRGFQAVHFGIDLGTSFIKAATLDLDRLETGETLRLPFPAPVAGLPAGRWEFDPEAILAVVRSLLAELFAKHDRCDGILMCTQMHGLVLTDLKGKARSNFVSWQDQRLLEAHSSGSGTNFSVLQNLVSSEERRQLGNELRPGLPICQCYWLAEQGLLPKERLVPTALADFVVANLCETAPVTELTNAAAYGALNLETSDWHWPLLERLGLAGLAWPEIRPQGSISGWFKHDAQSIPCYTPVGDAQAALAGSLLRVGELSLNIATGSQIGLLTSLLVFGNFSTRPFFDGDYLITVADIPAGRALNALAGLLTELPRAQKLELADPWAYILKAVEEAAPSEMRANIAFFHSDCGEEGQITHIREENLTVGNLFRAAFQNMAENYYACALRLSPEKKWRNLVFSGGLAQKTESLRQLICAQFQLDYRMSPTAEDTMLGLLVLALNFTGQEPSVARAIARVAEKYPTPLVN
jgi:sugar (pentulose or hexulose) kinase